MLEIGNNSISNFNVSRSLGWKRKLSKLLVICINEVCLFFITLYLWIKILKWIVMKSVNFVINFFQVWLPSGIWTTTAWMLWTTSLLLSAFPCWLCSELIFRSSRTNLGTFVLWSRMLWTLTELMVAMISQKSKVIQGELARLKLNRSWRVAPIRKNGIYNLKT